MALDLGRPLGLRAVRVPYESFSLSHRAAGGTQRWTRLAQSISHYPLAIAMRRQIRAAGLRANDWFFGKNDAGAQTTELLSRLVASLPAGTTEVGLHPASRPWQGPHAPPADWKADAELQALTNPALASAVRAYGVELCRWADLR